MLRNHLKFINLLSHHVFYTCNVPDWHTQVTDITAGCHPYDLGMISCCVKTAVNKNFN